MVRKGLTTRITGSCSNYYSTSGGSIYLDPVEEKKPIGSTETTINIKTTPNNKNEIVTVSKEMGQSLFLWDRGKLSREEITV